MAFAFLHSEQWRTVLHKRCQLTFSHNQKAENALRFPLSLFIVAMQKIVQLAFRHAHLLRRTLDRIHSR